jgi:MgsA AAA+ ATPase C terminal
MAKGSWRPQLKSGVAFDEVISGIQKTIRRGMEREALILAHEMFDSGYHSALARRLLIIACEDVGLANPTVVSQVYSLCTGYIVSKKDSPTGRVEPLALIMSIILLARSPKNRECDDAQIVTIERMKRGKDTAENVIASNPFIVDQHTGRGKIRLANQAAEACESYEDVAAREFLTVGAQLIPHKEVNGNPWGREVREMYGLMYETPGNESESRRPEAGSDDPPHA